MASSTPRIVDSAFEKLFVRAMTAHLFAATRIERKGTIVSTHAIWGRIEMAKQKRRDRKKEEGQSEF